MDLLSPIIGETAARIVILVGVLLLLAALTMLLVGVAFRVFRGRGFGFRGSRNRAPRLSVPDIMPIDSKRKLVLVRRDTVEHLLLIGGSTDLVIEQSIQRPIQAVARGRPAAGVVQPAQPFVTQSEIAPAPPGNPQPSPGRLGVPMPPPRSTRPTATAVSPSNTDAAPPLDLAPAIPPARQVGIAMPPRPMPLPDGGIGGAAQPNGSPGGHNGGVHLNGEADTTEETFTATAIPETSGAGANGHDDRLERDLAAVVPDVVAGEAPPSPPADQSEAGSGGEEDPERERAQRLTSRETEMAQLLNEIFGKR